MCHLLNQIIYLGRKGRLWTSCCSLWMLIKITLECHGIPVRTFSFPVAPAGYFPIHKAELWCPTPFPPFVCGICWHLWVLTADIPRNHPLSPFKMQWDKRTKISVCLKCPFGIQGTQIRLSLAGPLGNAPFPLGFNPFPERTGPFSPLWAVIAFKHCNR